MTDIYFTTQEAADFLGKSVSWTRELLQHPDKKGVNYNNIRTWYYLKERVIRAKKDLEQQQEARRQRQEKKKKQKRIEILSRRPSTTAMMGKKGVRTWCEICGYPFISHGRVTICKYCKHNTKRPQHELDLFFPKKKRSTPCPLCGGVRFVGQVYCSFCYKGVVNSTRNSYEDQYPGQILK